MRMMMNALGALGIGYVDFRMPVKDGHSKRRQEHRQHKYSKYPPSSFHNYMQN